jgi:hypothetical protein
MMNTNDVCYERVGVTLSLYGNESRPSAIDAPQHTSGTL